MNHTPDAALAGRTVLLTGAGGAIATAIADELLAAGAQLVLCGRGDDLQREAQRTGMPAVQADLTDPTQAGKLREYPVDALVHTAGAFSMHKAQDATLHDLRRMLDLNLSTLFNTVQAVLPGMLEGGRGTLIGISAGQAARGAGPGAALYTASKAAVAAYLKSLDAELQDRGVRATVLYPMGAVDTPANREAGMNPAKMIDPTDLAASVVHVLTRSARGHIDEVRLHPGG